MSAARAGVVAGTPRHRTRKHDLARLSPPMVALRPKNGIHGLYFEHFRRRCGFSVTVFDDQLGYSVTVHFRLNARHRAAVWTSKVNSENEK